LSGLILSNGVEYCEPLCDLIAQGFEDNTPLGKQNIERLPAHVNRPFLPFSDDPPFLSMITAIEPLLPSVFVWARSDILIWRLRRACAIVCDGRHKLAVAHVVFFPIYEKG
jgi:hypothetical protein